MKNLIQKQTCLFCFVPLLYKRQSKNLAKKTRRMELRVLVNAWTMEYPDVLSLPLHSIDFFQRSLHLCQLTVKPAMKILQRCLIEFCYYVIEFSDAAYFKLLENCVMIITPLGFWFQVLIKWITCSTKLYFFECFVDVCMNTWLELDWYNICN